MQNGFEKVFGIFLKINQKNIMILFYEKISIFEYCFVSLRRKSNQYEYKPRNIVSQLTP